MCLASMYYQAVSGCVTNMVRVLCRLKIEEPQSNETKINKDKQSLHFKVSAFSILLPFGPQDPVVHHFRHPVGSGFPWFSPSLRHRDRIHQGSQAVWCNRKPGSATTARRASCRSAEPWSQRRFCLEMNGERLIP